MEALTACSVACLTLYDMCKAVDRGMTDHRSPAGREVRRQVRSFHGGVSAMALVPVEDARARILPASSRLPAKTSPWADGAGPGAGRAGAGQARPAAVRCLGHGRLCGPRRGYSWPRRSPQGRRRFGGGHRYQGPVRSGEAVRIFTGAPLPKGADAVVIQENTAVRSKPYVSICERRRRLPAHSRRAG